MQVTLAIGYNIGNFGQFSGHYTVSEGFGEITVPILKNNLVQSLEFNTAGRITDYSTSGMVETWKMGVTSQVSDEIRLRSTWSFDIRAPNINELFSTGSCGASTNLNPFTLQNVNSLGCSGGNANLVPEQSTTVSGGAVLTPTFWGLEGLSLSADWYSITIKKAITTISATTITNLCSQGQQLYCNQISFTNGILTISATPINANVETTSGLDFQGDYNFDFMGGSVNLHAVGNYTDEQTRLAQGVYTSYAGQLGQDATIQGLPKFKGQMAATYDAGGWDVTAQGRFIGSARLVRFWGPLDVDDNTVPMVAYADLRGSYNLTDNVTLYGAVDNVTNVPPQATPSTTEVVAGFRGQIYDNLGRMFRAGIRLKY